MTLVEELLIAFFVCFNISSILFVVYSLRSQRKMRDLARREFIKKLYDYDVELYDAFLDYEEELKNIKNL